MKKSTFNRCITVLGVLLLTLFNSTPTKAQTDIIDKAGSLYGCAAGTFEINYNFDGLGTDSSIVIQNISGYRSIEEPTPGNKQYKFCAANSHSPCSDSHINGKFQILFRYGTTDIAVNKVNFLIHTTSTSLISVTAYQGSNPVTITGTTDSGGFRYTYDVPAIPCNYIEVVSVYDENQDPAINPFDLDDLHIPTSCVIPSPKPSTLPGSGASCTQITANWTASANATGYYLDVSTVNTFATFVAGYINRDVLNVTSFNVTGLTSGTTYYYRVRAYNTCGQSTNSGSSSYATLAAPAAPVAAPGTAAACTQITSNWAASANATGYYLDVSTVNTFATFLSSYNNRNVLNVTSFNVSGLTSGTTYYYRVRAYNGCGTSSNSGTITYPTLSGPAAPSADPVQSFCNGTTLDKLVATVPAGLAVKWYNNSSGGTALPGTTVLTPTVYYAETENPGTGCTSQTRTSVTVVLPNCPPEVVCVMDLSGSMQRDFFGAYNMPQNQWRVAYAKNALKAFAELLYSNFAGSTSYGLASFKNPAGGTCQAFTNYPVNTLYESNYNSDILPIINALSTEGGTPLLAGLEKARSMFQTPDMNEKKVIVLLSDGAHNCPPYTNITSNPAYTTLMNQIIAKKIKVYTIAFGQSGEVDPVLLADIAGKTGGEFYDVTNSADTNIKAALDPGTTYADVWDAGNALDIAYSHVLNNSLKLFYSADPLGVINKGTTKQYNVSVSGYESKITFFISWVKSQPDYLGIKIKTSNGSELPVNNPNVKYIHRDNYSIITVSENYLNQPGIVGVKPWRLILDGTKITESEKFQYLVFNQSQKLKFNVWFDKNWYYTGDKMKIYLEILKDNKRLTNIDKITISGSMPKEGYGNVMANTIVTKKQLDEFKRTVLEKVSKATLEQVSVRNLNSLEKQKLLEGNINSQSDIMTLNWLKSNMISEEMKDLVRSRVKIDRIHFYDKGTCGDKTSGDGLYTAVIGKITKEGSYIFNISAVDSSHGNNIKSETQLQKYIKVKVRPTRFVKKITPLDTILKGMKVYNITLSLQDKFGNIPSLNALSDIELALDKGKMLGSIEANPDGSFTQMVGLPENINPSKIKITMKILDQVGVQWLKPLIP